MDLKMLFSLLGTSHIYFCTNYFWAANSVEYGILHSLISLTTATDSGNLWGRGGGEYNSVKNVFKELSGDCIHLISILYIAGHIKCPVYSLLQTDMVQAAHHALHGY